MQAQVEQAPLPPVSINPNIPTGLNDAILKAMEKDPASRFASAMAFRDALDVIDPFTLCLATAGVVDDPDSDVEPTCDDLPPIPAPAQPARLPVPQSNRYMRVAVAAILGTLLALAAGIASIGRLRNRGNEAPPAEAVVPVSPGPPPQALPPVPPVEQPAAALDPSEPSRPSAAPAPAVQPLRPKAVVRKEASRDERKSVQPLPAPVVHNAPPSEPLPSTVSAPEPPPLQPVVLEAPPVIPVPAASPGPIAGGVIVPAPAPPPEATKATEPAKTRGVRGFFGRILNPVRKKPAEKKTETSGEPPASKP
jgi:hypothetical protein